MEASDVSLFSSIVGVMLSGRSLEELDVRVDGEVEPLPEDPIDQAAHLLWLQLYLRTTVRPPVAYWLQILEDLTDRQAEHKAAIKSRLKELMNRLGGLQYRPEDMWSHIDRVSDDPHTVVSINPPTYKGGFEKFFDTKGRLTWAEPEYEVFDPIVGIPKLIDMMEGRKALLVCQQQREPGHSAHKVPIFARHLSPGQYVYLNSNRPDEIFEITGGPKVSPFKAGQIIPSDYPIISYDAEIRPDSKIDVMWIKNNVADYYRNVWVHRLSNPSSGMNLLVTVDGKAAGIIGYSTDTMGFTLPGRDKWAQYMLLRYAMGAPHQSLRLTRLITMIAMQEKTALISAPGMSAFYVEASDGILTVEMTRHMEVKGLRGLMKLVDRKKHPDGNKLFYTAPWTNKPYDEVVREFLEKEERWQKTRERSK
jgi:hypothetical protein